MTHRFLINDKELFLKGRMVKKKRVVNVQKVNAWNSTANASQRGGNVESIASAWGVKTI